MSQEHGGLKSKLLQMSTEEFSLFKKSYLKKDFLPEAQKIIEEVLDERRNEIDGFENQSNIESNATFFIDLPKNIVWQIYFFCLAIFQILMIYLDRTDTISVFFRIIHSQ